MFSWSQIVLVYLEQILIVAETFAVFRLKMDKCTKTGISVLKLSSFRGLNLGAETFLGCGC